MQSIYFYISVSIVGFVFFYFLKDAINNSKNVSLLSKLDEMMLEQKKQNFYLKIIASKALNLPQGEEFDLEDSFYKTLENL